MNTRILTPRECVKEAIADFLLDFRKWITPDTKSLSRWKSQTFAYAVAEGRLIDQFEKMLDSYRKKSNELPILIIAVKEISAPPDVSQLMGVPYELDTVIKADPLQRRVKLRTEPAAYHVQFAFVVNDPDSATSLTTQFCSYIRLMEKRRVYVSYFLAPDFRHKWPLTILDNSIFPDSVDIEQGNLTVGLLDFDFYGVTPRILAGMPPLYGDEFTDGRGTQADGTVGGGNNGGGGGGNGGGNNGDEEPQGWDVVIQGDMFKERPEDTYTHVEVDLNTGEKTDEIIKE
ncbi:hypothetical protein [Acinetobacter sp. ANC 3813]|uniref:hypothetical protein n=1 Tax=Acinetobacter sp. ANC 3813 TaxID=1977873 RepID=UPI000A3411E5|nr:hypothetical protein [Acinetobacter sp. ANC 3813]OTG87899.1 hypothetical protein B9T34_16325 [Acinetobacter sp. ANC 3813]